MKQQSIHVLALLASGLLAACGGSDEAAAPPPPPVLLTEVPESALASPGAYTQFTLGQSQAASESDEPLTADKLSMPPASESDEPLAVS
ncbi:hypothetical protein PFX98_12275 [Paucibacter sediminis]|uniref:Uncharacterized protein n=1 Tax=Paucibacter sediminis TaxID=3019553 RepID=A0AA95SNG5_9BURK|nr:hypothetical protein [Paucibacter sp. S2-9]WIT14363.1 hypothetical protein PFX98_12275 [Paucibacter sp. S2-9]